MFKQPKLILKATLMKNPIIHKNMSKIRGKSTDTIIKKRNRVKSPWRSSNIVYSCPDIFFCRSPDTKSYKKWSQGWNQDHCNLTEEDGFRKLTSNSNHKNSYFYSYKYLKNKTGSFFLIFFFICFSFNQDQKEKPKKIVLIDLFTASHNNK